MNIHTAPSEVEEEINDWSDMVDEISAILNSNVLSASEVHAAIVKYACKHDLDLEMIADLFVAVKLREFS